MAVKGVFTSNANISGARKGDFASGLLQTQPNGSAPLLALTSGMSSRDAMDTVVTWFEENHLTGRVNITNNASTGTSIIVDDASAIVAGHIFYLEASGELVFVESVSGLTLTVQRGFGGTTATAIDGSSVVKPIQRIGTAFEEGSSRPTAYANLGFPRINYMQIFRNSWDVTGTAQAVQFYTGNVQAKNRADAALFHAEDQERAMIWGRKTIGTLNSKPFRTMDGIKAQFVTNGGFTQSSNTKWIDLKNFFKALFAVNIKGQPNERVVLCGNEPLNVLDQIAYLDGTIEIMPGQADYGMQIVTVRTPFGTVVFKSHPLMVEHPVWTKDMMCFHPAAIEMRYLRRTNEDNYDQDGSRAGADSNFGVFTTEMCVTYKAEKTGGWYAGIDTAAATT